MEQSMMAEPAAPAAAPSGLSLRGLWEVFYKPSQFFAHIKNHPRVLIPWILAILATTLTVYLVADFMVELQREAMLNRPNVRPEMVPPAEQMKPWMYVGVVFFALLPLVTAAIAMFWGNFVFGGSARFSQILSVMLYGFWVYMVGGIIQSLMAVAKGSIKASLSLAALVPNRPVDDIVYVALSKISVFQIWEIIVVGIGLSVIYGFSRNKGYLVAVLSVGLMPLLNIVSVAIQKALT